MDAAGAARARRGIRRRGHLVGFRRVTRGVETGTRADVKAVIEGYAPTELVNGITAGTRHLIVSKLDLEEAGFPVPPVKGDRIFLGPGLDVPTTIGSVDADHREFLGCYDIVTTGN